MYIHILRKNCFKFYNIIIVLINICNNNKLCKYADDHKMIRYHKLSQRNKKRNTKKIHEHFATKRIRFLSRKVRSHRGSEEPRPILVEKVLGSIPSKEHNHHITDRVNNS